MKKSIALILALVMILALTACGQSAPAAEKPAAESAAEAPAADEKLSAGFVTFGLGGDFFQALADQFVATMNEAGWDASYADGEFNPTTQIEAMENYIAQGVDTIVVWSVAPEAMTSVVEQAQNAGIDVVAFVAPTEKYDALMVTDNAELADNLNRLAAKWIDSTFADAEDHSVPVAVFTCRTAETGVVQGDELLKIEEFSTKAKFAQEVELQDENTDTGLAAAENLYTTNPEIKVFLSAHNGLALGINNYFTGLSSPVTDYSDMGIFCINGNETIGELIQGSVNNETPFRGMVLTGSVLDTTIEMRDVILGLRDGSFTRGDVQKANTVFVDADTVNEYMTTGSVKSVTAADFEK